MNQTKHGCLVACWFFFVGGRVGAGVVFGVVKGEIRNLLAPAVDLIVDVEMFKLGVG